MSASRGAGVSLVVASLLLPAVVHAAPPRLSPATGASLSSCQALTTSFTFANTVITSAEPVAAGTVSWGGRPIPAHCLVKGQMHRRTSPQDGKPYAIGFEMRLPNEWNGRFYYQANGGIDGAVVPALGGGGPQPTVPLAAGICGHQLRRRAQRVQRSQLRHRRTGASRLRLPGGREAHADGQGAHPRGLRQASRPIVLRRLLEWRAPHLRRDDEDARRVRRLSRGRTGVSPAACGDRQPVRRQAVRHGGHEPVGPRHGVHGRRAGHAGGRGRGAGATRSTAPRTGSSRTPTRARRRSTSPATCPRATGARNGRCLSAAQKTAILPIFSGAVDGQGRVFYARVPLRQRTQQQRRRVVGVHRAPPDRLGRNRDDLGCAARGIRRRSTGPAYALQTPIDEMLRAVAATDAHLHRVGAVVHAAGGAGEPGARARPGRQGPRLPRRQRRHLLGQRHRSLVPRAPGGQRRRRVRLRALLPRAGDGPLRGRAVHRPVRPADAAGRVGRAGRGA